MSTFIVRLNQGAQGALDKDPSTMTADHLGTPMTVSRQRQVYVMGPRKINRLLKDGDTFTDCNYWKKFAYPQCSLENAIVVFAPNGDDGSTYVEGGAVGTVPVIHAGNVAPGATVTIDFVADHGGATTFCQIENLESAGEKIKVYLNGGLTSFDLDGGASQIFNSGDLAITKIVLDNTASGASPGAYQVIAAIASECNS